MTFKTPSELKCNDSRRYDVARVAAFKSWNGKSWNGNGVRSSLNLIKACGLALAVAACSGGGDSSNNSAGVDPTPPPAAVCDGQCTTADSFLTVQDVQKIMAQAVAEAQARGVNATIAVTDRVGNVLGVFRMGDAAARKLTIATRRDADGNPLVFTGLEGITLPVAALPVTLNLDHLAAISKAVTASYLSTEGNAFSTRSANQIVQEHFNPGETFQPGGPLFGVQFSQLGCSDLSQRFNGVAPSAGPQRSPFGLSADPGGLPLYKAGALVGAVSAEADGFYSIDAAVLDLDNKGTSALDEAIAWAGSFGFVAPTAIQGDVITIDGKSFRFSDVRDGDLMSNPANAATFTSIPPSVGSLIAVNGYANAVIQQGTAFGTPASGIRAATDFPGRNALLLVDSANNDRFPIRAGTDAAVLGAVAPLTATEVWNVINEALGVANQSRAGIRRATPNQSVRVTVSIVDSMGNILGIRRTSDPPNFGIDVSLQKARSVAFMSSPTAADYIASLPVARYLTTNDTTVNVDRTINLFDYVSAYRAFTNNVNALTGETGFGDRSIGNLARPFFPDGFDTALHGPFSKPRGEWSVFSSGLQLDLSINGVLQHVLFAAGALGTDPAADVQRGGCVGTALAADLTPTAAPAGVVRLGNGLQIFAGGVPIERNGVIVGAIGISGDGIDQDDMVAFLGLDRASRVLNGSVGNVRPDRRADSLLPSGSPLQGSPMRYVQCPQKPFLVGNEQKVCEGK